jgi:RimJ/RimL family protein N-acetyltransferase
MLTVRELDTADAGAWASLRQEALEAHPLAFGASVPDDPRVLLDTARDRLTPREGSAAFGVFDEGRLVGNVGVTRHERAKERHKALIWGMYVSAHSRQRGAGALLLRAAIDRARSWAGVEQVLLTVSALAPEAKRLYERHGFCAWGLEPRALQWHGRFADDHHMILDLHTARAPSDRLKRT